MQQSDESDARPGLVDGLRTTVAAAGSDNGSAATPMDAAAAARQRILDARKKQALNFEAMRLKLLLAEDADDDDNPPASAPSKSTGSKKAKAKGSKKSKPTSIADVAVAAKLKSPSKADKLRAEVAASKDGQANTSASAAAAAPSAEAAEPSVVLPPAAEAAPIFAPDAAAAAEAPVAAAVEAPVAAPAEAAVEPPAVEAQAAPQSADAPAPSADAPAVVVPAEETDSPADVIIEAPAPPAAAPEASPEASPAATAPAASAPAVTAPAAPAPAAVDAPCKVFVRYNHKNGKFPVVDGQLDFSLVDASYCLSYVLKGEWSCSLRHAELGEISLDGGRLRHGDTDEYGDPIAHGTFSGLRTHDDDGGGSAKEAKEAQYVLQVQQDPSQAKAPREAYRGSGGASASLFREGSRKEGCSCIWGNPCVSPEFCVDWHNRFEVAKRNAGKR